MKPLLGECLVFSGLASVLLLPALGLDAQSQVSSAPTNQTELVYAIDLPTVLRLANAQNIDIQIARQRFAEAKAVYEGTLMQFLPWLAPGLSVARHENLIQDVTGNIIDVHKESYRPGLSFDARVDLGDAIYNSLAARQSVRAAGHGVEVQRQDSVLTAVQSYFDLAKAQAQVEVAKEAQRVAMSLERQLGNAVEAGIGYKGDALRAKTQTGQIELSLRHAVELQRTTGARLAEVLHLDPAVELIAREAELLPLSLIATNVALGSLIEEAQVKRPELRQIHALISAAVSAQNGSIVGPLIPSLGGQAYLGGLGGGMDHGPSRFGQSEDYSAFLFWRIGPGGLFDFSRIHLTKSRLESLKLGEKRIHDGITRQVVESFTRFRSLSDQLATVKRTLETAVEAEKLAEQRKESAVGAVLEDIQTQQDLTRARNDFVNVVVEFNKAQYALQSAVGSNLTRN